MEISALANYSIGGLMDTGVVEIVEGFIAGDPAVPAEKRGEVLKGFSTSLLEVMDTLDEAIEEGQFEEVVSNARMLKDKLVRMGLEELSMVAGNIETAATSTSPLYLSCYYMRLRRDLLPLLAYAKN